MFEDNAAMPLFLDGNGNVVLSDYLRGSGTRAYRVSVKQSTNEEEEEKEEQDNKEMTEKNLVYNPSYEISLGASVPDGNYITVPSLTEDAATFFADRRLSMEGRQALRLTAPSHGTGLGLSPYTVPRLNQTAKSYTFSVWYKGARGGETLQFRFNEKILTPRDGSDPIVSVAAGTDWRQMKLVMDVGSNITAACPYGCRRWLSYGISSKGTVWLDVLSLTEDTIV
jgi:hypothetical protein